MKRNDGRHAFESEMFTLMHWRGGFVTDLGKFVPVFHTVTELNDADIHTIFVGNGGKIDFTILSSDTVEEVRSAVGIHIIVRRENIVVYDIFLKDKVDT